jgi:hypothetical protein
VYDQAAQHDRPSASHPSRADSALSSGRRDNATSIAGVLTRVIDIGPRHALQRGDGDDQD